MTASSAQGGNGDQPWSNPDHNILGDLAAARAKAVSDYDKLISPAPKAPRGSLIKFLAECGHWMDCYALEPTPTECEDCANAAAESDWDDWDL